MRDCSVWSGTDERCRGARIISINSETSDWIWNPAAKACDWHRFFLHQYDLTVDYPRVIRQVAEILRFWIGLGVDAFRLDAVPCPVEREGTANASLPETHAVLRRIRAEVEACCVRLAEATRDCFGAGDECGVRREGFTSARWQRSVTSKADHVGIAAPSWSGKER